MKVSLLQRLLFVYALRKQPVRCVELICNFVGKDGNKPACISAHRDFISSKFFGKSYLHINGNLPALRRAVMTSLLFRMTESRFVTFPFSTTMPSSLNGNSE